MTPANRCPKCGGIAKHLVTDMFGRPFYHCTNGLTSLTGEKGEITRSGNIVQCDTVIDSKGGLVTGTIAYMVGGNTDTIGVTEGKIRR